MWNLDDYPLAEEIGNPDLFVGREREMQRLLQWAEETKPRNSKSTAILSRRKKGKTALLQRFYNILYERHDPRLIPFYYRIPENVQTKFDFTEAFYRRVLTQYFAFTTRTPKWVGKVLSMDALKELAASDRDIADDIRDMEDMLTRAPTSAWTYAQEAGARISQVKDVRIIQILDEFQYMNEYIVSDNDSKQVELLCHSYMGPAESKYSPQIVAGSYIGWLEAILSHLTGRHRVWELEGLRDAEALEAVYNYAAIYKVTLTDETASHIAEVCGNDPWYIASTISNRIEEKDLTTIDGVREALALETIDGKGEVARIWREYLDYAFPPVSPPLIPRGGQTKIATPAKSSFTWLVTNRKSAPASRSAKISGLRSAKTSLISACASWSRLTSWPGAHRTTATAGSATTASPWSSAGSTAKRSRI